MGFLSFIGGVALLVVAVKIGYWAGRARVTTKTIYKMMKDGDSGQGKTDSSGDN